MIKMVEDIKKLRVQIDGLAQLTKELKPIETGKLKPDVISTTGHEKDFIFINSKEIEKSYDSLILAKAWLGKVLEELGSETPYTNDGKRKKVKDIESASDVAININTGKSYSSIKEAINNSWLNKSHIEKVDFIREEIKKIIDSSPDFSNDYSELTIDKIALEQGFVYKYLSEARFWLGFELQRIKESK